MNYEEIKYDKEQITKAENDLEKYKRKRSDNGIPKQ